MKHLFHIAAIALLPLAAISCGKSDKQKAGEQPAEIIEPTVAVDNGLQAAVASGNRDDIMAIVDELSGDGSLLLPDNAVTALMGYIELSDGYRNAGRYKQSIESMRSFIDLYDLARSSDSEGFNRALNSAKTRYPSVDFEEVYATYSDKLAGYDGSGSAFPEAAKADSTAADSTAAEIAPEFRPAE